MKSFDRYFGVFCYTILVMHSVFGPENVSAASLDSFTGLEGTIAIAGRYGAYSGDERCSQGRHDSSPQNSHYN